MDTIKELVKQRPVGPEALKPAFQEEAVCIAEGVYMSQGTSSAYMVVTEQGRVIINTGMGFEAPIHKKVFDAVCPGPTPYILLTQGHVDHVGGVRLFREEGTKLVAQENLPKCQADDERISTRRESQSYIWFDDIINDALTLMDDNPELFDQDKPVADIVFEDSYCFELGSERFELYSASGGETIDSIGIWLPNRRMMFTGNMFGPLFPHFPNFNTIRGDRYRDPERYLATVRRIKDFRPQVLVTGHGDPIVGEDLVQACLQRLEDAVSYVYTNTLKGILEGKSIYDLMREVTLPDELYVGQGYGRVAWGVRTIWEQYMGWFKAEETSELYPVRARDYYPEIVGMLGKDNLLHQCHEKLNQGDVEGALIFTEMLLSAYPQDNTVLNLNIQVHERLLENEEDASNFWLGGWLRSRIKLSRETQDEIRDRETVDLSALKGSDVMAMMPSLFLPDVAKKADVVIQFNLTGNDSGEWTVIIKNGNLDIQAGQHSEPTCILTLKGEDFAAIMTGRLNPIKAFMMGRIKAEGDRIQARILDTCFKKMEAPKAKRPSSSAAPNNKPVKKAKDIVFHDLAKPRLNLVQRLGLVTHERKRIRFDMDDILNHARQKTGMSDFGPDDFRERLQLLVDEYNKDDGLTGLGQNILNQSLQRYAINRLLIQEKLKSNPAPGPLGDIRHPLIVVGMPRSGTTHMLNLLGADSRFQSLPLWVSEEPFHIPGKEKATLAEKYGALLMSWMTGGLQRGEHDRGNNDPRYLRACMRWASMQLAAPEISSMHPMNPDHIHEECELGCNDFDSYKFEWTSLMPRWRDYYLSHDQSANYRYIRQVLSLLQIERQSSQPWVLKCPQHIEQLPVLRDTFPDATLVMTHRDPVAVIQSAATMMAYSQRMMRKKVEIKYTIEYWIDRIETLLRAGVRDRHIWGSDCSIDVPFDYFMKNDMDVVQKIYDLYGMTLTNTARKEMQDFIDAHPRGKFGKIRYNLKENFGIDPEAIRERFGFYYDTFDVKKEV